MDKLTASSSKVHLEPKILKKGAKYDITDGYSKTISLPLQHPGEKTQPETGRTMKRHNSDTSSHKPKSNLPLKSTSQFISSKVSFFDKHNRILNGTLRWVGKNEVHGTKILGIQAVSSL